MTANISEFASAGFAALQVGARSSAGFFAGYAHLAATDVGVSSGMHRMRGAITAPVGIQEPTRKTIKGDDGPIARFQFASDADNGFTLEMGITDLAFEDFAQGTTMYTLGEWDMHARGIPLPVFRDIAFLMARESQSEESTSVAAVGYENMLVLSSQGLPLGDNQFSYQAEGGDRYGCIANMASVLPWGVTATAAVGSALITTFTWWSEFPCSMDVTIGNAVIVALPLSYAPISVAKTHAFLADTAAALTVSSVSVGGKTATVSAAPASGKYVVTVYETPTLS